MTKSAHALSNATGSADASMPRSGMMAASLWFQQSHSGDTFMMKLMWKCGLSEDLCGCDKFHMVHPDTDWLAGLRHAEKIGLGTMDYELIKI